MFTNEKERNSRKMEQIEKSRKYLEKLLPNSNQLQKEYGGDV
jgi:hypothetical protein